MIMEELWIQQSQRMQERMEMALTSRVNEMGGGSAERGVGWYDGHAQQTQVVGVDIYAPVCRALLFWEGVPTPGYGLMGR
jgi:hypothetical protein